MQAQGETHGVGYIAVRVLLQAPVLAIVLLLLLLLFVTQLPWRECNAKGNWGWWWWCRATGVDDEVDGEILYIIIIITLGARLLGESSWGWWWRWMLVVLMVTMVMWFIIIIVIIIHKHPRVTWAESNQAVDGWSRAESRWNDEKEWKRQTDLTW